MVSAQVGGDGKIATDAAGKLDAAIPIGGRQGVPDHAADQGVAVHDARAVLAIPTRSSRSRAPDDLAVVRTMYHYARAVALRREEGRGRRAAARSTRIAKLEATTDFKPFDDGTCRRRRSCRPRATSRPAARRRARRPRQGPRRTRTPCRRRTRCSYTEPPYWYYPVRQSLGSVLLRQGKLDEAREGVPRVAAAHAQQRLCARRARRGLQGRRATRRPRRPRAGAYAKTWTGPAAPGLAKL
jgi:hypothetical protein